jgi:hypothetical protein
MQTPLPLSFPFGHCVVCPSTDSDYPFGILKLFLQNVRQAYRAFSFHVYPLFYFREYIHLIYTKR